MTLAPTYRMLSLWQPWADFLVPGGEIVQHLAQLDRKPKDVENRGYGTPWRGILLVHASQRVDREAMNRWGLNPEGFVRGAVVGVVRLVDVVDNSDSPWAEPGRKHWRVTEPVRLASPVECAGFQGPRPPTPHVLATVLARLDHQRTLAAR